MSDDPDQKPPRDVEPEEADGDVEPDEPEPPTEVDALEPDQTTTSNETDDEDPLEPDVPTDEDALESTGPADAPDTTAAALPLGAPAVPRRTIATSDAVENDPRRLNLDWLVPTIAIVIVVVLLWLTILWTMAGGNFFGFPSLPEQTSAVSTRTPSATPTPSPTPTTTEAPVPDPSVAAPTFVSFGAPTSVSCIAPAGDDEVAAVAFSLSWGSLDAESASVAVDGGDPQSADATGAFSTSFPCPAASATYVVTLEGRGGTASRTVTVSNVGYAG